MIFGTIVGGLADKHGRKRAALIYVISYTLGCFTKHFNSFWILFFGRVFCGVATSLLYSAFESWLVAEHFKRGFNADWLGGTFSQAVFLGNGLMAILSGLIAHTLVETLAIGPVAPFDAAAIVLVIGGVIIYTTWSENHGDSSVNSTAIEGFSKAARLIMSEPKIALLGAMQALFEGSMYTFVFLWTPALSPNGEHIPHGMVFACFMVASMVGSAIAGRLLSNSKFKVERYMQLIFAGAAACLFVPVMYHRVPSSGVGALPEDGITFDGKIQLAAFCAFEGMVGVFWPSMMTMRSAYVPEEMRSTIINFFRIPLNLFVCVVLYNVSRRGNRIEGERVLLLRYSLPKVFTLFNYLLIYLLFLCRYLPSLCLLCLGCVLSSSWYACCANASSHPLFTMNRLDPISMKMSPRLCLWRRW